MKKVRVFIVPGFFGFNDIGTYNYFFRVKETLENSLREKFKGEEHIDFEVIECKTLPTSSIRRRAKTLIKEVLAAKGDEADELYFIGHSTGGLDVRLLLSPGIKLEDGDLEEKIQKLTKAVFTISTPHFGTPLANFFTTLQGRQILRLLVAMAVTRAGRLSLFTMAQTLNLVSKLDDWIGRKDTFFDSLNRRLLIGIDYDPDAPIWKFLEEVGADQGAILQLTQEAMDIFNAGVSDLPNAKYYCILTSVKEAELFKLNTLISPRRFGTRLLFKFLQKVASREHGHYPYPVPDKKTIRRIEKKLTKAYASSALNDGIVPLYSQVHGEVLNIIDSDHLDIVGHFFNSGGEPLSDWLSSGSNFNEGKFQQIWKGIAKEIAHHSI